VITLEKKLVDLKMDAIDKSILFHLAGACRASFSQLATQLKIPEEDVKIRITYMVNNHYIQKFTVVLNPLLLQLNGALLLFRSLTPLDSKRLTLLGIHSAIESISMGTAHEGFAYARYSKESDLSEMLEHWHQFHKGFEELHLFAVEPLFISIPKPTQDLVSLEKVDWLILAHLREQGRLPLQDLSKRTGLEIHAIIERLDYLRHYHLIIESININPVLTQKETLTLFKCELTMLNHLILQEIMREVNAIPTFWQLSSWRSVNKPYLFLGFYCSSYTEVEKIQNILSDLPGIKSIEKIMGGSTYYFTDIRDELIEEKRSHGWFSPEKWVTKTIDE
jgi:DNA-binding Lrp family transcriptional regulator